MFSLVKQQSILFLTAIVLCCDLAGGRELTQKDRELLESSNIETIEQILEIVDQIAQWKQRIEKAHNVYREMKAADDADSTLTAIDSIVNLANDLMTEFDHVPPEAQEFMTELNEALEAFAEAREIVERASEAYKDKSDIYFDISEAEFEKEVKQLIFGAACDQYLDGMKDTIEAFQNPAEYLNLYVNSELREFFEGNAMEVEIDGETLLIYLRPEDRTKPILSSEKKKHPLTVILKYGDVEVHATNFYLQYRDDGIVLNTDEVEIDREQSAWKTLENYVMGQLGSLLSDLMPTGVKVTIDPPADLKKGGAIVAKVKVNMGAAGISSVPVTGEVSNIKVYPRAENPVVLDEAKIAVEYLYPPPGQPVPFWVLAFYSFKLEIEPTPALMTGSTAISSAATVADIMGFFIDITVKYRATKQKAAFSLWRFNGSFRFFNLGYANDVGKRGGIGFCKFTDNTIDFSKGHMTGKFEIMDNPLKYIIQGKGDLDAKTEYVHLTGDLSICQQDCSNMEIDVRFDEKYATISVIDSLDLAGANFASTLTGLISLDQDALDTLEKGVSNTDVNKELLARVDELVNCQISAVASINVPGTGPFSDVNANVSFDIDSERSKDEVVHFKIEAFSREKTGKLPDLKTLADKKWLKRTVADMAVDEHEKLLNDLKRADNDFRKLGSQIEANIRKSITNATGIARVDDFQREIDRVAKNPIGPVAKMTKKYGNQLNEQRDELTEGAKKFLEGVGVNFGNSGGDDGNWEPWEKW